MVISDEQLESFRKIYFEHYGKEISKEDAYEQAIKLVRMMRVIYKPMTKAEWNLVQEIRENRRIERETESALLEKQMGVK